MKKRLQLDEGGIDKDWSLGYDIKHNYNWLEDLKFKTFYFLTKNRRS